MALPSFHVFSSISSLLCILPFFLPCTVLPNVLSNHRSPLVIPPKCSPIVGRGALKGKEVSKMTLVSTVALLAVCCSLYACFCCGWYCAAAFHVHFCVLVLAAHDGLHLLHRGVVSGFVLLLCCAVVLRCRGIQPDDVISCSVWHWFAAGVRLVLFFLVAS